MILISDDVEFRRVNSSEKDGKTNYYYTFEDEKGSFQVYSKEAFVLDKGEIVRLKFSSSLWNNRLNFNLIGIEK